MSVYKSRLYQVIILTDNESKTLIYLTTQKSRIITALSSMTRNLKHPRRATRLRGRSGLIQIIVL